MKIKILLLILFYFISTTIHAQNTPTKVSGKIHSFSNEIIDNGTLLVKHSKMSVSVNSTGGYEVYLTPGSHTLVINVSGYKVSEESVEVVGNEPIEKDFYIESNAHSLNEVVVIGNSPIQNIRESAYNVVVIDATTLHNTTLDVASVLDRVSGIKVRSDGGVGSDVSFSLNGFSGRHIKFFMDGVPMDGFGAEFKLSNIPINLVDRIEVYKTAIPIEFGTDALGGVINIVTREQRRTSIDASFATGSFNTYLGNVNLTKISDNGFAAEVRAFYNYSDNDYKVFLDPDNSGTDRWVKRFNDEYRSGVVTAKVGLINKKFADRLFVGFTYGKTRKGIQHGTTMDKVFGERHQRSETVMPSLEYTKKDLFTKGLNVKFTANYNLGYTQNIDTTSFVYNWLGEATKTKSKGESGGGATMIKNYNNNGSSTFNVAYAINDKHQLNINNVLTLFDRKTKDPLAVKETESEKLEDVTRRSLKDIIGMSYKYTVNNHFNVTVFGKQYLTKHTYLEDSRKTNATGYGLAATYFLYDFQLKGSYEKSYRLPNANELFGDGALEWANFQLQPEKSDNFSIGLSGTRTMNNLHMVYFDVGYLYKSVFNYIIRNIYGEGTRASMDNHGKVLSSGINAEVRYIYNNLLSLGGNITYQSVTNNERYKAGGHGVESTLYKLKMPNVPYMFGNADAGITIQNLFQKTNDLYVGYNMRYTHQFYYDWSTYGDRDGKSQIPTQLSHDANVSYSPWGKQISLSAECRNITNEKLYDNYYIQKPGRSFMFKVRYVY